MRKGVAAFVLASLAIGWLARPALAHGGVPVLTDTPAGPYVVSVWAESTPLRAGVNHLSLAVGEADSDALVTDVRVRVEATYSEDETTQVTGSATQGDPFYDVDLALARTGPWEIVIQVDGPLGSGQTGFEVDVEPDTALDWRLVAGAAVALGLSGLTYTGARRRHTKGGQ